VENNDDNDKEEQKKMKKENLSYQILDPLNLLPHP
jgi:hypothetical protein